MAERGSILEASPLRIIRSNTPLKAKLIKRPEADGENALSSKLVAASASTAVPPDASFCSPLRTPIRSQLTPRNSPCPKRKPEPECHGSEGAPCSILPCADSGLSSILTSPTKTKLTKTPPKRASKAETSSELEKVPIRPRPGSALSARRHRYRRSNICMSWPKPQSGSICAPEPTTFNPAGPYMDRFIPNRAIMSMEGSQVLVGQSERDIALQRDPAVRRYREDCARAAGFTLPDRVLTFSAPVLSLRARAERRVGACVESDVVTTCREVPTQPDRTLDAPGFEDDFYTNLLAWSSANCVAIGLKDQLTPDSLIYIWNATTGAISSLGDPFEVKVHSISWSLDGTLIAVGLESGECQIWDPTKNEVVRTLKFAHPSPIPATAWSSTLFATGSKSGRVSTHDLRDPRHLINEKDAHTATLCNVQFSVDGTRLASGGNDGFIKVFDVRSLDETLKYRHGGPVKALAWCPWNPSVLASGGARGDKRIHTWNASLSQRIFSAQASSVVTSLTWAPHYRELLATHGKPDNSFSIWTEQLAPVAEVPAHSDRILQAVLSPDGMTFCTVSPDNNLKFWLPFSDPAKPSKAKPNPTATRGSGPFNSVSLRNLPSLR
ncbi:WD repeat-containing protein slp1 [Massospora cicadina]|nr:WD repeat-containing protein slp1 [Massospora cicadina]